MGVKGEVAGAAAATAVPAPAETMNLDKSHAMQAELERQFQQGRRRQGGGTFVCEPVWRIRARSGRARSGVTSTKTRSSHISVSSPSRSTNQY
eukprot:1181383-Prorocentrum_minimum.AAC.12